MQTKNPSRQKGNPARRIANKVVTLERPGGGANIGGSAGEFKLEVAVQIAADTGALSFFDFSVANNFYTETPDCQLEPFIRSCAQASVHSLWLQIAAAPVTAREAAVTHVRELGTSEPGSSEVTVLPAARAILECAETRTVSIRLVSTEEMTGLNRDFRGKAGPTNVLSFAALDEQDDDFPVLAELLAKDEFVEGKAGTTETEAGLQLPLGDIAICTDIVRTEAESQQKPALAHLAHMVVHGILHLMGYDHESEQEAGIMEPTEIVILRQLGFNNPYT